MFFWWIYGEKSGLPILFLHHLSTVLCFLLFNMLSRLVIAFLPRKKHLLISLLQSPSAVILECSPPPMKSLFSLFLHLYSTIDKTSPFEDNGLLFWVPDVLCGHSEVVCGIYSKFKCSFDEFVGEKVVSPSYSSTILGLPPICLF